MCPLRNSRSQTHHARQGPSPASASRSIIGTMKSDVMTMPLKYSSALTATIGSATISAHCVRAPGCSATMSGQTSQSTTATVTKLISQNASVTIILNTNRALPARA